MCCNDHVGKILKCRRQRFVMIVWIVIVFKYNSYGHATIFNNSEIRSILRCKLSQCIVRNLSLSGRVCSSGNPRILAKLYTNFLRSIQLASTGTFIYRRFKPIPGLAMLASQLQNKH